SSKSVAPRGNCAQNSSHIKAPSKKSMLMVHNASKKKSARHQKNPGCASAARLTVCAPSRLPTLNDASPILKRPSTPPTPRTNPAPQHCWKHFGNESTAAAEYYAPNTAPSLPSAWMISRKYHAVLETTSSSDSPMAPL